MSQRIVIDPVTRIEGHAKITLLLDEPGEVSDARFHVTEFRGFEKFVEGRFFREMPGITARICGICPVSHMLSSAKAGDEILAAEIPDAAVRLRRLSAPRPDHPVPRPVLYHAFAAAKAMTPPPDNIVLLTDGLPTQGEKAPRRKTISGKDRLRLLERSLDALPRRVPVNVILYPMEGDPMASPAFWKVAMATRGSMMTPSSDGP